MFDTDPRDNSHGRSEPRPYKTLGEILEDRERRLAPIDPQEANRPLFHYSFPNKG
jgi:hypothetical protein